MMIDSMMAERESSVHRRAAIHAALADPNRLTIVDELVLSDRSPSELGGALGIGSNLLAHHLDILEGAGLIARQASAGDGRRKYLQLVPETLAAIAEPVARFIVERVVFVCTANSARSQLAAAAWNAGNEVRAESAGTHPAERVLPMAVDAGRRAGLHLEDARPRPLANVAEASDLIVTVCDIAHEEIHGLPAGAPSLHWSIPDPALVGAPPAFDEALRRIQKRVELLSPHVRPPRGPRRSRP